MTNSAPRWAVLTDFDGTITTFDIGDALTLAFGAVTQEEIEKSYADNASVPECMRAAFAMVSQNENEIAAFVKKTAVERPGFIRLAKYCRGNGIPLEIVSGGLDIYIRPILQHWGIPWVPLICAKASRDFAGKYELDYSYNGKHIETEVLKEKRVRHYQKLGYKVAFCGDANSDLPASRISDAAFVRHRLVPLCREQGVKHTEFETFDTVMETVRNHAPISI